MRHLAVPYGLTSVIVDRLMNSRKLDHEATKFIKLKLSMIAPLVFKSDVGIAEEPIKLCVLASNGHNGLGLNHGTIAELDKLNLLRQEVYLLLLDDVVGF
ncbi:hypothetical protein Tco_1219647 [Tanacetum coccineum]